jgi:hypothetical protein
MMAHASKDAYWRAQVRYETGVTPGAAAEIEDKCLRCHAPANHYGYREKGVRMPMAELPGYGGEGVTCTVCHQIEKQGLGETASFGGGFVISGAGKIYGPHAEPFAMPMQHHTAYTPVESKHILEAGLCGSCHTVVTPTLDSDGRERGQFLEQAPFLEWLASSYPAAGRTCQSCHVEAVRDSGGKLAAHYIAHNPAGGWFPPTSERAPFGLHWFAGANVWMLETLKKGDPDRVISLGRSVERAREQLRRAARLEAGLRVNGGEGVLEVVVKNLSGHKLPTGFPSRRLWLHVRVVDGGGATVFESGRWDGATGELVGVGADQPHYGEITRESEAMIYEARYRDVAGKATTSLLRAAAWAKDNRLLPVGFEREKRLPGGFRVNAVGTEADAGFRAGEHRVQYRFAVKGEGAKLRAVVEACYQSIAPAHGKALGAVRHADIARFQGLLGKGQLPEVIARVETEFAATR